MKTADIQEEDIKALVKEWYQKLDDHAPVGQLLPLLAENELIMVFPEARLSGQDDFQRWYHGVVRSFFDEIHDVKSLRIGKGEELSVSVTVEWQASRWIPPAARSERIILVAEQLWSVQRIGVLGKPVISRYEVLKLDYKNGSARL